MFDFLAAIEQTANWLCYSSTPCEIVIMHFKFRLQDYKLLIICLNSKSCVYSSSGNARWNTWMELHLSAMEYQHASHSDDQAENKKKF